MNFEENNYDFPLNEIVIHEAAKLFPDMREEEYQQLKSDIRTNGLKMPISLFQNKVVDGRHRLRACQELEIHPKFVVADIGAGSVGAYVVSMNLHRRHLSDSQRGMIAAQLAKLRVGDNQHTAQAVSQRDAAAALNVSVDTLQRAKKVYECGHAGLIDAVRNNAIDVSNAGALVSLNQEALDKLVAGKAQDLNEKARELKLQTREANRERRAQSINELRKQSKPLDPGIGPFNVIYADPPWDYIDEIKLGYPTMGLDQICSMPVKDLADKPAVLLLWVPASLIGDGLKVIEAWGFKYRTQAIWAKGGSGQGPYFRVNHEVLLLATRGHSMPEVPLTARFASVFEYPRREHSQKPEEFYDVIEQMYPEMPKLELFRRGVPRAGWYMWGNEVQHGPVRAEQRIEEAMLIQEVADTISQVARSEMSANDTCIVVDVELLPAQAA